MSENPRARRLAERIQQITASMLGTRVKDPRLGYVTITEVRVTGDLQHATIFYTVLGDDEDRASSAAALASASGLIRSEIGREVNVRLTPSIEFVADALPESALALEEALAKAAAHDAQVAALAAQAQHAGETDPYRTTDLDVDDEED